MARHQLPGQLFDACDTIDCWANAGEIEPIATADIAVENITDVQCQTEPQPRHSRACERRDICLRLTCGGERALACLSLVVRDRKNRQQPIAHELQHFAPWSSITPQGACPSVRSLK